MSCLYCFSKSVFQLPETTTVLVDAPTLPDSVLEEALHHWQEEARYKVGGLSYHYLQLFLSHPRPLLTKFLAVYGQDPSFDQFLRPYLFLLCPSVSFAPLFRERLELYLRESCPRTDFNFDMSSENWRQLETLCQYLVAASPESFFDFMQTIDQRSRPLFFDTCNTLLFKALQNQKKKINPDFYQYFLAQVKDNKREVILGSNYMLLLGRGQNPETIEQLFALMQKKDSNFPNPSHTELVVFLLEQKNPFFRMVIQEKLSATLKERYHSMSDPDIINTTALLLKTEQKARKRLKSLVKIAQMFTDSPFGSFSEDEIKTVHKGQHEPETMQIFWDFIHQINAAERGNSNGQEYYPDFLLDLTKKSDHSLYFDNSDAQTLTLANLARYQPFFELLPPLTEKQAERFWTTLTGEEQRLPKEKEELLLSLAILTKSDFLLDKLLLHTEVILDTKNAPFLADWLLTYPDTIPKDRFVGRCDSELSSFDSAKEAFRRILVRQGQKFPAHFAKQIAQYARLEASPNKKHPFHRAATSALDVLGQADSSKTLKKISHSAIKKVLNPSLHIFTTNEATRDMFAYFIRKLAILNQELLFPYTKP